MSQRRFFVNVEAVVYLLQNYCNFVILGTKKISRCIAHVFKYSLLFSRFVSICVRVYAGSYQRSKMLMIVS